MNDESTNKIWRPVVEPTDTILPCPGSAIQRHQATQPLYTKTSLVANQYSQDFNLRSLNREILSASQAYNNTPKPFSRQGTQSPTLVSGKTSALTATPRVPSISNLAGPQQVKFATQSHQETISSTTSESCSVREQQQQRSISNNNSSQQQESQEENMAPKLVHKQYNSPIDLYSMNNIRKTIEAHTELIAPGLKGINFMKPDTPVNKQSEVYKLVMEEEEQQQRARQSSSSSSRLSPISGQPVQHMPTALADHQRITQSQANIRSPAQHLSSLNEQQHYHKIREEQHISGNQQHTINSGGGSPVCCECGQFIVGPFAKIQNRFVHPQCFNCTTCGTSLKNTGYFTVNEKLYCDIHAKQVANMMHIQYDFADKQNRQQHQLSQTQMKQQSSSSRLQEQVQQSVSLPTTNDYSSQQQQCSSNTSPATISTMFADRSDSDDRREVRWAWRPATTKDRSTETSSSSSIMKAATSSYQQQHEVGSHQLPTPEASQQSISVGTRSQGVLQQEGSLVGGRAPVCVHCHVQIHGPYILAGKTTWCKLCSQTNFNCSSCHRSLLDTGFIEDNFHKYYCEHCFEAYFAPICTKCNIRIKGDCLNALGKQWHPSCFVCGHCRRPFGNSSFYLEDNVPYCERDWNILFTTKCYSCSYPIEAGDKWIEALDRNYHSNCFRCTSCQANLEGSTFYCKGGKPYCRLHAR